MKRILSLFLAVLMLLPILVSCKSNDPSGNETNPSETTEEPFVYPEPDEDDLILAQDKLSDYVIMLSSSTDEVSYELEIATALRDAIEAVSGVRLRMTSATKTNAMDKEILFGNTVREGNEIEHIDRSKLGDKGYHVLAVGERIVFAANSREGYLNAVNAFTKECLFYDCSKQYQAPQSRGIAFADNHLDLFSGIGETTYSSHTVNGAALSDYVIVCGKGFNDVAKYLSTALTALTGTAPEIYYNASRKKADCEIVIGPTERDDEYFHIDYSGVSENECKVVAKGTRIGFLSQSVEAVQNAVVKFLIEYFGYEQDVSASAQAVTYTQADDAVLTYSLATSEHTFVYAKAGDCDYEGLTTSRLETYTSVDSDQILCCSTLADEMIERIVNEARLKSRGQTEGDVLVSLVYNTTELCQCDACRAAAERQGSEYGAYFELVIRAAEQIKDEFPLVKITILVNDPSLKPCTSKFPDNVMVYFRVWDLCAAHAINDSSCPTNKSYCENLEAWVEHCSNVVMLDMTSDYFYFPTFFPNFLTVRKNINYYASLGIRGVYLQFDTTLSSLEFGGVRSRLYEKLLADPTMDEGTYLATLKKCIAQVYDADHVDAIYDFILLLCNNAAANCWTPFSRPNVTCPIPRSTDENGNTTYDLTVAVEATRLWEVIHPYIEGWARSELYLGILLFNQYQRSPEAFSMVCFTDWLTANIDYQDKAWVLNSIYDQLGIAH